MALPDRLDGLTAEEIGLELLEQFNSSLDRDPNVFFQMANLTNMRSSRSDQRTVAEGWNWLASHGYVAPDITQSPSFFFVTRKGRAVRSREDAARNSYMDLLPAEILDSVIAEKVLPIFRQGNFDIAVLAAFKEVEVRIRKAARLSATDIGVNLARKAFHPETGSLTDTTVDDKGERQAVSDLFAGA
jgi:hypothetical protein